MRSSMCIVLGLLLLVSCSGRKQVVNEASLGVREVDAISMQRDSLVWGKDMDEVEMVEVEWWGGGLTVDSVGALSALYSREMLEKGEVTHGGYRIRRTIGRHQKEESIERSAEASSRVEGALTRKKVEQKEQVMEPRWKRYRLVTVMSLVAVAVLYVSIRKRMREHKSWSL